MSKAKDLAGLVSAGGILADGTISLSSEVTGVLPLANGGTNATTAGDARTSLGAGTGDATLAGTQTFTGNKTFTGVAAFTGTSSNIAEVLTNAAEICTISATAATGTIALYPSTQSILYYTSNASANWTVNLTFSAGTTMNTALSTGQALSVAFLVTQGATPYYNNVVQVDGSTSGVTTIWQNGAPTGGNASGVDVYTYTVIKTGSATFTVLGSVAPFKA